MSQLMRVCILGGSLAVMGCGAQVSEMGAAKDAPKVDEADIQKKMMEGYEKNKHEGEPELAPPGGAPGSTPASGTP